MSKELEIGVHFWPWNSIPELVSYAEVAMESYPFDCIWMCDEFQYEDPFTAMAAMAIRCDVSVGTMVTFPWRNPMDLAQRFASISKLTRPGRYVAAGIGAGGAVQIQVTSEKAAPLSVMRESVQMLREQFQGKAVELARFPELAARFRYNLQTSARLHFPPAEPIPVYLGAGGPKMNQLAGQYADGMIFSQLVLRTSLLGLKAGFVKQGLDAAEAARPSGNGRPPFKKHYLMHVSVSADGEAARQWGKRNASYGLAGTYIRSPELLDELGIDREEVAPVADAYRQALGVPEAANRVSDSLLKQSGQLFAGTPAEIIEPMREMKRQLLALGFDNLVFGVPLGPDVPEALRLLGKEVIPALMS